MNANIQALLNKQIGQEQAVALLSLMHVSPKFRLWQDGLVTRAELAQALNMVLFAGILERVPTGKAYTDDVAASGGKVVFDHGALRTVRWFGIGELPPGEAAFTRILKPLGFQLNGVFPLERLKMTGRSYAHIDDAEGISQFFVSELHPERFSKQFQHAVSNVLGNSVDPLTPSAVALLAELDRDGNLPLALAEELLPVLVNCFGRQHEAPAMSDYELLLQESPEMAWIATEGNVFNHATDRVADVFALSDEQKALGRPIKPTVEVSGSGRVKQTAFKADMVVRQFRSADGELVERTVPGSFYEFITRDSHVVGGKTVLDLGFDTSNAQGIFKMTANS